jgi:hypothetical protein
VGRAGLSGDKLLEECVREVWKSWAVRGQAIGRVAVLERWYCKKSGTVTGKAAGRVAVLERWYC